MGIGVCEDGSELMILNGILFVGDKVEVSVRKKNYAELVSLDYSEEEITSSINERDRLIPVKILKEHTRSKPGKRIFELDKYICFSDRSCEQLLEHAYANNLQDLSQIKIARSPGQMVAAVKWYGIDFIAAVKKCMEEGVSKSYYYSLEKKQWDDGVSADFWSD